jgi:hypothetical protein
MMISMSAINPENVAAVEDRLLAAVKVSSVTTLEELLHPDLLFHTPGGDVVTADMDLDAHRSGKMIVEYMTPSERVIRVFGDTAIVSLLIDTKGKMLGQPIQGRFRYIRVWKMFGEGLRVIGGSCIQV